MMIVYLGKHPKYYNSEGNRRLKVIVRETLPAYEGAREKNTRAAKTRILKATLERAYAEGLSFVRIVGGVKHDATSEEAKKKISHLFRDLGAKETARKRRAVAVRPGPPVVDEENEIETDDFLAGFENLEDIEQLLGLRPVPLTREVDLPFHEVDEGVEDEFSLGGIVPIPVEALPIDFDQREEIPLEDIQPIAVESLAEVADDLLQDGNLFEAIKSLPFTAL